MIVRRAWAGLAWIVGAALLLLALRRAALSTACVHCVPSFDVADYLNQALDLRDASAAGRLLAELRAPALHPPGHAAVMALAMGLLGTELPSMMQASLGLFGLSLAALLALGHALDAQRGRWAGLIAAGLTATSVEHVRLSTAPMTENLALTVTLLTLALGARSLERPSRGLALAVGVSALAGALVRYNLGPMLLAPLLLAWLVDRALARGGWLDPRPWLWALPTALTFGAWGWLEPGLPDAIFRFLHNVDSGLPTWSAENLSWAPRTFAHRYLDAPALAVAVGALAALGLLEGLRPGARQTRSGDRVVGLYVLLSLAVITLHPYKLTRTLHGVVPPLFLLAALPLVRLPLPRAPHAAVAARALGLAAALCLGAWRLSLPSPPEDAERPEVGENPEFTTLMEALVAQARGHRTLEVLGNALSVNPHSLRLTLRSEVPGLQVRLQPPLPPSCVQEPVAAPAPECALQQSVDLLRDPDGIDQTVWVVLTRPEPGGESRRRRRRSDGTMGTVRSQGETPWYAWTAERFEVLAQAHGVPRVAALPIEGRTGRVQGVALIYKRP